MDLGMRPSGGFMVAFAENNIVANEDRTHDRIGAGPTKTKHG
jgi:hypothetical protein